MGSEAAGRSRTGLLRGYLWLASALVVCPCHIPLLLAVAGGTALAALLATHWALAIALSTGYVGVALLFAYRRLNAADACAVSGIGRNPVFALVLSAFLPGLGQSYNRQRIKAGAFLAAAVVTGWPLFGWASSPDRLSAATARLVLSALLLAATEAWSMVDAYRVARTGRVSPGPLGGIMRGTHLLRSIVLLGTLFLLVGPSASLELRTNLSKALVPLDEIVSGGPPPDGIPAIDHPRFVTPKEADRWLQAREPVLSVSVNGDARAYPLQILLWHEIVNDTVGGKPVAVTYCPLCNSGIVFDRTIDGNVYDFGTSGKLYKSDLVMYDRQTSSLWAQMEGRAIVGDLAGTTLAVLPANTLAYGDWKAFFPGGKVLSRETGHSRDYGRNPYDRYDAPQSWPFLFSGPLDRRLPPKERVVGVSVRGMARAYPFSLLAKKTVVHDVLNGERLVVLFQSGTLSALDQSRITASRDVGTAVVFSAVMDGRSLSFEPAQAGLRDRETGSLWTFLGRGVQGVLAGKSLTPVPQVDAFWFAWAAFHPSTSVFKED